MRALHVEITRETSSVLQKRFRDDVACAVPLPVTGASGVTAGGGTSSMEVSEPSRADEVSPCWQAET